MIQHKTVMCFAQGRDGDWEGLCLDFDIAVQGRSFEDVKRALEDAIESYVRDAGAEDEATARRLLARSAPFFVRLDYVVRFFFATLFNRGPEYRYAFIMPISA